MFDSADVSSESIYKKVSHAILFALSMVFTISLFYQFSDKAVMKGIYILFAITLELLKNYLIKTCKALFRDKDPVVISHFIVFMILATISGIATYGSILYTLEEQKSNSIVQNMNISDIEFQIKQIDNDIESVNRSINSVVAEKEKTQNLEGVFFTAQGKLSDDIARYTEKKKELMDERTNLVNSLKSQSQNIQEASISTFDMIGNSIGIKGSIVLLWIFISLIVILEVALYITTEPFVKIKETKESEEEMIGRYVDSLMNGGVRLRSDKSISEDTGISIVECKKIRSMLSELKHRGKFLIVKSSGGTKASFPKSVIKRVVAEHMKVEIN